MPSFRASVKSVLSVVAIALLAIASPALVDVRTLNLVSGFNFVGLTVSVAGLTTPSFT